MKRSPGGRKPYFPAEGELALLILKNWSLCSDQRLLEQLNGNLFYQIFCGVWIDPSAPLGHRQLVSTLRGRYAHKLNLPLFQSILAKNWKGDLSDLSTSVHDATCYESEVRYPTDVKLLWESVSWLYPRLVKMYRDQGLHRPRTKYKDWELAYRSYRYYRKPPRSERRRITAGLLRLLGKLLSLLEQVEQTAPHVIELGDLYRIQTLKKVYEQQAYRFVSGASPKDRIVSLAKDYLRPIIRGKENKPVEFGAKVNKIQVDGLNFIEHISFDPFHEGIRLKKGIELHHRLFGTQVKRVGADRIYATNENRSYCTEEGIFNDFIPKGRKAKDESQRKVLRKALTKERASRLEGSFGNEKNAYHLRRIRAKTKENEILWILLGIHTANAREIAKRRARHPT
ncbi:MAG: transposase [Bacteroidota bacterium]